LRFDTEAGAKAELGSGRFAIVPGNLLKSALFQRISSEDESVRMPPASAGHAKLSEREIGLIRSWIEEGARWQKHWAFLAPKRPELPQLKNRKWPRNSLDYFVLERLEQEGLTPSPEADGATLIRRNSRLDWVATHASRSPGIPG
jgi:hypothetical protein